MSDLGAIALCFVALAVAINTWQAIMLRRRVEWLEGLPEVSA